MDSPAILPAGQSSLVITDQKEAIKVTSYVGLKLSFGAVPLNFRVKRDPGILQIIRENIVGENPSSVFVD